MALFAVIFGLFLFWGSYSDTDALLDQLRLAPFLGCIGLVFSGVILIIVEEFREPGGKPRKLDKPLVALLLLATIGSFLTGYLGGAFE